MPRVDVTGCAAVARVDVFDAGEYVFTDYVSLYRAKGAWKVVGKLVRHHRPSVAPGTEPEKSPSAIGESYAATRAVRQRRLPLSFASASRQEALPRGEGPSGDRRDR